jgi:uncharacterized protein
MNSLRAFVKRQSLLTFFVLAYALAWLAWILYTVHLFPAPIFDFAPSLAAIIVVALTDGKAGLRTLFSQLTHWRVGWGWYAVALLAPIPFFLAVVYVNVLLGAPAPTAAQLAAWPTLGLFLLNFLFNPFGGAWEELGWRGYAQPQLQRSRSALTTGLIVGALWAGWHLPLFFVGKIPWPNLFVVFFIGIIYAWLFNNTKGSVLIAYLAHAALDAAADFFVPFFSGADLVRVYWIMVVLLVMIALILVIRYGPTLIRKPGAKVADAPLGQSLVTS